MFLDVLIESTFTERGKTFDFFCKELTGFPPPAVCKQTTTNHEQTTSEIHPGDEADGNGRNCHPGG